MVSEEDYAAVMKVKEIEEKLGRKTARKYCRHFYGQSLLAFYTSRVMGAGYDLSQDVKCIDRLIDDLIKKTDLHIRRVKDANSDLESGIQLEEARRELAGRGNKLDG